MLCDLFGTTVDEVFGLKKEILSISPRDRALLEKYHSLDPLSQSHIDTVLDWEVERAVRFKETAREAESGYHGKSW